MDFETRENRRTLEVDLLRAVYEDARRFLRNLGVDQARTNQAVDDLDSSIEAVKQFDGGLFDPDVWALAERAGRWHDAGVQAMAETLRRILDGEPCHDSNPPELAEVSERLQSLAERLEGLQQDCMMLSEFAEQANASDVKLFLDGAVHYSGMPGCAHCRNPLFVGFKCSSCGRQVRPFPADG